MSGHPEPSPPIQHAKEHLIPDYALGDVFLLPVSPITLSQAYQPQNRMAFSPLPTQPMSIEGLALLGIIFNFARTKEGNKSLERIIVKYLDSCARIIESVQDACHSNWLTALNNQMITATISHRIGLMDDAGYMEVLSHYRSVFDKMFLISGFETTFTGITTLVQGSKTTAATTAEGGSTEGAGGIPALTAILTKAMAAGV